MLAALAATLVLAAGEQPDAPAPDSDKLRALRQETERLRAQVAELAQRERGVLGEIERLDAELRLSEATVAEAAERVSVVSARIDEATRGLAELERVQSERRAYLSFRLREMYKRGPGASLRRLLGGEEARTFLAGLRYATYLTEKDRATLESYRKDAARLAAERDGLLRDREALAAGEDDANRARAALAGSRAERARYLGGIKRDRLKTENAIQELETAANDLGGVVGRIRPAPPEAAVPPSRSKPQPGTLDWPVPGKVTAGFGRVVHPQFKTVVPHPGLDIEAAAGTDIRAVLEGRVAYSAWLRGYGLTAIVDHGGGLLTVYAHAAALLAEQGEQVERGQVIGKVGDTGSLRGTYLYFEMRQDGKPVDPARWLKRR